jgi:hypothetical protein
MRLIGLAALGLILALSLLAADAQQAGKAILPSSWFNANPTSSWPSVATWHRSRRSLASVSSGIQSRR